MGLEVNITWDWETVSVQYPLFVEHVHLLRVECIRIQNPTRLLVKWKGAMGDELHDRIISETFELSRRKGRERFKDFLFSIRALSGGDILDLEPCIGRIAQVMAVRRRAGQSWRWHILHHSVDWNQGVSDSTACTSHGRHERRVKHV